MMINWKVRFQNKTWLLAFAAAVLSFCYQLLAMFNIVPAVSEDVFTELISMLVNILVTIGIIQDPTTAGLGDSHQALTYTQPKEDKQ